LPALAWLVPAADHGLGHPAYCGVLSLSLQMQDAAGMAGG
jgi:hypothetical protein